MVRSDSLEDTRAVYTHRWIVFDEDMFILRDAYVIETLESFNIGEGNTTYTFGDFPPNKLARIDAVYRSAFASDGPNWLPSWPIE